MSRTYILQSQQLAVAAARMKCDANYIGVVDSAAQEQDLRDNHVFIENLWREGSLTPYRLRCLVHQLKAGDVLLLDSLLSDETLVEVYSLAKRAQCVVIFAALTEKAIESEWARAANVVVEIGANFCFQAQQSRVIVPSELAAAAAAGALALCQMNGLGLSQSEQFVSAAVLLKQLPWYDEVAYSL